MGNITKSAAYYRLGLQLGVHRVADVIAWADSQIANSDSPPTSLIDIALMKNANPIDVMGKLKELSGYVSSLDVIDMVLGAANLVLKEDPSFGPALARGLYDFFVECEYNIPEHLQDIAGFDDEYALAAQGTYGSVDEVYKNLLLFTGRFNNES